MSETDFNCNKCDLKDTDRMVQCDSCDKWFHFECVKVDSNIENVSWSCSCCGDQSVAQSNECDGSEHMPAVNNTADFTAGRQASSSPANMVQPGTSQKQQQKEMDPVLGKGAYKKAHNPSTSKHGSSTVSSVPTTMSQTTVMPLTKTTSTYSNSVNKNFHKDRHFENSGISDVVPSNMSQTQLQLQMLEEEKELQRQYLEKKYKILSQGNVSQPSCSFSQTFTTFQPTAAQIAARQVIPKDLPNFDGNPEDWPLFISNFKNSTEIAGYTDGENLMRLQSCLRGRAKELVKSKLLIPSMVGEIIQTLEMCFGRPEHILDGMIDKAMRIPPLKDRLDSIIEYALTIKNICSTMEACDMKAHLNNPMLVKTLVDKLPNNHKLSWAMHQKDSNVPIVKVFSDWIYNIAAAASQVVSPITSKKGASVNTHQDSGPRKPTCFSCKSEAHKIQSCGEFQSLNLEARWKIVKENKLCRQCLNSHRRKCFSNKVCEIGGCKAKHHPLLHNHQSSLNVSANNFVPTEQSRSVNSHRDSDKEKTCFRILPIRVFYDFGSVTTFAFLDEGSSVTLMEKEFFNKLGIKGKKEPLELRWTGNTTRSEDDSVKINIEVSGVKGDSRFMLHDVRTVKNLELPKQTLNFEDVVKYNPHLKGLPVESYVNAKPTILIGVNNWRVAVPMKIREGGYNQFIATKTRLGWTLQGSGKDVGKIASLNIHTCECERRYQILHDEVKEYFSLDVSQPKNILSIENQRARQILENNCAKKNQQFEVSLLWKDSDPQLPNSYNVAVHRLKCLMRKFKKNPELKQTMQKEIDKLLSKGYARKVLDSEMSNYPGRTWYLPIFVALNPNKPGKVRLVWDAAAKSNNKSLNDYLLCGPDLLTSLFNVLIEFRVGQVAVCGDIAEMFHRINVKDEDMHAQRFLWFENGDVDKISVYVMKALTFGISCAPCIAHFVRNKNADDFRENYPRAVKAVESYHYMDDFIDSVQSEEEALELALQVKTIHAAGGFHMRNWVSNSKLVQEKLGDGELTKNTFGAVEKILVGRHKEKRWGVLFTCLTVRAIHIEVAHSLDTSSCIMCIQNFISRRGSPKEIYTDNGTNFKSVERMLQEERQHLEFKKLFSRYDFIKWRFNPPAAPHMGGAWERLIRSVKSILYSMCPAFKFNDETLRCALYEVEFIINSRPLTFVALNTVDDDALTPNHLLLGSAAGQKPLCEYDYDLRQRWHQTQQFANNFWRRWVREYGPMLVRRSKWFEKVPPPTVGDVVIIVDDTLPRNKWPKGIVTELFAAKDGQVRSVKVRTSSSEYERPVTKIAVLDVGIKKDDSKLKRP
ncbi:uncharacterized protein [Musca autumnalis]|uniref:uncharacterized protein n=1 Tax=Musca autumnalis TaxID=221902 RepID=UPI003CED3CCF